MKGTGNTGTWK